MLQLIYNLSYKSTTAPNLQVPHRVYSTICYPYWISTWLQYVAWLVQRPFCWILNLLNIVHRFAICWVRIIICTYFNHSTPVTLVFGNQELHYVKGILLVHMQFYGWEETSTIFGNKCCFSGGRICNNISVIWTHGTRHGTRH